MPSTVADEVAELRQIQGTHAERIARVEVKTATLERQVRDIRSEVREGASAAVAPLYRLLLASLGAIVLFGLLIAALVGVRTYLDATAGTVTVEGAQHAAP